MRWFWQRKWSPKAEQDAWALKWLRSARYGEFGRDVFVTDFGAIPMDSKAAARDAMIEIEESFGSAALHGLIGPPPGQDESRP